MEFRLQYEGSLPAKDSSTGVKKTKHAIRKVIHKQLAELWKSAELQELHNHRSAPDTLTYAETIGNQFSVGAFKFVPFITEKLRLVCTLDILFLLRREDADSLISKPKDVYGGDLDNRLKILLDALRIPNNEDELPSGAHPDSVEQPYFYCLLQDDSLITKFQVEADKLLRDTSPENQKAVQLIIKVTTKAVVLTIANMALV